MAVATKLQEFLKQQKVPYEPMHHSAAYTASEVAGAQHIPGKFVIKSVIIKAGNKFIMCVLKAIQLVDFAKLEKLTGLKNLALASEGEVAKLFPDFDKGAEPPFGHLYGLEVFIDESIKENEFICFNAGTHTDLVKLKTTDFLKIAKGKTGKFGRHV